MKSPSKAELHAEIAELKKENASLKRQLTNIQHRQWLKNKEHAVNMLYRKIPFYPSEIKNLVLDHIDKVGYWFNFYIINCSEKQTYCVRHTDL